jgi:hypothetical protein
MSDGMTNFSRVIPDPDQNSSPKYHPYWVTQLLTTNVHRGEQFMKLRQIRPDRDFAFLGILAVALLVISLCLIDLQPVVAAESPRSLAKPTTQQVNRDRCYAVADGTIVSGDGSAMDTLAYLDRGTGQTTILGTGEGNTGVFNIEAIAFQPGGSILYAADAGQLGTLDLNTGLFTPLPNPFGQASGFIGNSLQVITIQDVDGLSWDVTTGIFYGTDRRAAPDLLFQIDPVTGLVVQNAFTVNGTSVDFVEVGVILDPDNGVLDDVDDIAVDPVTGALYASVNRGGSTSNYLAIIDKETGAVLSSNLMTDGVANVQDVEGLAFFNDGSLYGSSGKDAPAETETLYRFDKDTGMATVVGQFSDPLRDIEGLDCLIASAAIVIEKATNGEDADEPTGPIVEVGQPITWTYFVRNTGGLTLENVLLSDDNGTPNELDDFSVICRDGDGNPVTPLTLQPGESNLDLGLTCEATGIAINGQYGNVATVTGIADPSGETVTDSDPSHYLGIGPTIAVLKNNDADGDNQFSDSEEAPSGDATVTFQVVITNTGSLPVTIDSIADDIHGADGALTTASTFTPACADLLGELLAPGASLTCYFDGALDLDDNASEVNTVTVTASTDLNSVSAQDTSTVRTPDVLPTIQVDKTADPVTLPEPGGVVTFTVVVTNTSVETVTLTSLIDDVHGDLDGRGTCAVPQTLPIDGVYTCIFPATVTGVAGYVEIDTVTATAQDDDGNTVTDSDDATVTIIPAPTPLVEVVKTLDLSGDAADGIVTVGQDLTFTIQVRNTGNVTLTVVPLTDTYHTAYLTYLSAAPSPDTETPGALGWDDLTGPGELAPQGTISVTVTFRAVASTNLLPNQQTINIARVEGATDGNTVAPPAEDDAPVRITDPRVAVAKTVTDPADGRVARNGLVTFTISITNTGDTVLDLIPVRDIFDPADFAYIGSSLSAPPQLGSGEVSWTDVTTELGDPAPGETISFQVTFRFINATADSATNVVRLGSVLDEHTDFAGTPQGEASSSTITPTPILLLSFTARAVETGVALEWITGAELDAFGFHLWRSPDPRFEQALRATQNLIAATGAGGAGATYQYLDTGADANVRYYWLQEVASNGETTLYGPISVGSGAGDNPSAGSRIYLPMLNR